MKIIGSDFDGTLNYGGIDDEKRRAISDWRKKGNKFVIVSGRGRNFFDILKNECDIEFDYLIVYSGGMILTPQGQVLYEAACDSVDVKTFAQEVFSSDCDALYVNGNECFIIGKNKEVDLEFDFLLDDTPPISSFYQLGVPAKTIEMSDAIVAWIKEKYGDRLNPLQNGCGIDVVPKGVNKAQGLYKLTELCGCSCENVITVGDNMNDMDMIKAFSSYAMENGCTALKNAANHTVKSITELIRCEI